MRLFYYEYETTVFLPFDDLSYELQQGYLILSPFGVAQHFEEGEVNNYTCYEEFIQFIGRYSPINFEIVELV